MARSAFPPDPEPAPVVQLERIVKRYPGVVANAGAALSVRPGEFHAVVGENGSGKSTLMGILAGSLRPDDGMIRVDGEPVRFRSPAAALAVGIGMVHQQLQLVEGLTVLENVMLGREPTCRGRLDTKLAARRLADLSAAYDLPVDPTEAVGRLSYAERLRVELLRLLSRDGRVVVLDEPTACLFPAQAEELLDRLAKLAAQGVSIVLVSHRLDEVVRASDRITVMRAGRTEATFDRGAVDVEQLAVLIGGDPAPGRARATVAGAQSAAPALVLTDAVVTDRHGRTVVRDVGFEVRPGEVVGVAGLLGDGPVELIEALAGLRPFASGRMLLGGRDVTAVGPAERRRHGLAVVLEEGSRSGLLPGSPLWENVVLGHSDTSPLRRGPWIDRGAARQRARELCHRMGVRPADVDRPALALSGGNQQKLVVGRELAGRPRLLLVSHPTQGLDIAARDTVHGAIDTACREGTAVVMVSSDPNELAELADVVLVMRRARVVARLERPAVAADRIGVLMAGGAAP